LYVASRMGGDAMQCHHSSMFCSSLPHPSKAAGNKGPLYGECISRFRNRLPCKRLLLLWQWCSSPLMLLPLNHHYEPFHSFERMAWESWPRRPLTSSHGAQISVATKMGLFAIFGILVLFPAGSPFQTSNLVAPLIFLACDA
jgi:hypothetical protein